MHSFFMIKQQSSPVKQIASRFAELLDQRFTKNQLNSLQGFDSCIREEDSDLHKLKEVEGKRIVITDIGGSFVKLIVYEVRNGKPVALGRLSKCFCAQEKKVTVDELAAIIIEHIKKLLKLLNLEKVDRYSETFSFPAEISSEIKAHCRQVYSHSQEDLGKGWFIKGMSEVNWTQHIVEKLLAANLVAEASTVSVNDTVAVLLALIRRQHRIKEKNVLAGVVMGTGFNIAIFDNEGILRNLEAAWADIDIPNAHYCALHAHYSGIDRKKKAEVQVGSAFGAAVVAEHLRLLNLLDVELIEDWSRAGKTHESKLLSWAIHRPRKLRQVLENHLSEAHMNLFKTSSRHFFERATQVVAGMLLGIADYKKYSQKTPLIFGLNGSLGLKAANIKEQIINYVKDAGYQADVVCLPHSTLEGPVIAGLNV